MAPKEAVFRLADGVEESRSGEFVLRSGVTAIALLDAEMLVGEYEVFEALNEAFRFPVYFGWNWDALYDCLADLTWIPADRYLVVIKNAQHLDLLGNHSHRLLVHTLRRAAQSFSSPIPDVRRESAEFLILLSRSAEDEVMVHRFRELGVELDAPT